MSEEELDKHMVELDKQEVLKEQVEDYGAYIQDELQIRDDERLGPDALDLDVDDIIRAEKCTLSEMEMDEYQEMDESMDYTDKMSFLRWETCLANRNRQIK
jgi:hypothetical protein